MRLDKFLCEMNIGSRREVKEMVRRGMISVNGFAVKNPDQKIDEKNDCVCCQGQQLCYQPFHYLILNKPKGVITATRDDRQPTVMDCLKDVPFKKLSPVGRLDKDTHGLLFFTDDGELSHRLLAPNRHVDKTYLVTTKAPVSETECGLLETGVDIGEKALTLPAKVNKCSDYQIFLTIHEGKFHQVKRMLQAIGNEVVDLKRISFGPLKLDEALRPGEYRALTEDEIASLQEI